MQWEGRRLARFGIIAIVLFGIIGYSLFEARFLIEGPIVTVTGPKEGEVATSSLIEITGKAQNISDISLNDRKIFIDEEGHFSEQLLLSYGYNILTLKAKNRFGRETKKVLEVVYQ